MRSKIRLNMRNAVLTGLVLICFALGATAVFAENGTDAAYASSAIDVDGTSVDIEGYNINGNNYFKLRDLGNIFDFSVGWDSVTGTITVNTSR